MLLVMLLSIKTLLFVDTLLNFYSVSIKTAFFMDGPVNLIGLSKNMAVFMDANYIIISFKTPDAVWYAPAPAPWITSGDG